MLIYYVIALLVYFGILSLLTKNSSYQSQYLKGGMLAALIWPILYLIARSNLVDYSILRDTTVEGDPRLILASQERWSLIIGILLGLLFFVGIPILLKWRVSCHKKSSKKTKHE